MPFDLGSAKPVGEEAQPVAPTAARKFNLATAKPVVEAEQPEEPGYLEQAGNYVKDYAGGIGNALGKAAEGDEALDGLKDLAQGAGSFATQIAAPVAALPRLAFNRLGLTNAPDESYAESRDRFVYTPEDRGAQGISELPGAVLKPVGDVFKLGGKLAGGAARGLGASDQAALDIEQAAPDVAALALGARGMRAPKAATAAPKVAPKVAPAVTPAEVSAAAGFKQLPSSVNSGFKGLIGRGAESVAGSAKVAQRLARSNAENATRLAKEELGVAPDVALTPEQFSKLKATHNAAYDAVGKKLGTLAADEALKARIAKVGEGSGSAVTPNRGILKLRDTFSRIDSLPAAKAVQEVRSLRENATANIKTPFGAKNRVQLKELGKAQQAMADILDDWIVQSAERAGQGDVAAAYKNARVELAKIHTVERATDGGRVSAQKLVAAAKKGAPLTGRLKIISDTGAAFPETMGRPTPASAVDSAIQTAADAATFGLRGALARPIVSRVLESDVYQRALGGAAPEAKLGPNSRLGEYFPEKVGNPAVGPRAPQPVGDPTVGPTAPPYGRVEFTPTAPTGVGQLAPDQALLAEQLAGDLELVPELTGAPDNLARVLPTNARIGSGSEGTVRPGTTDVAVGNQRVARTATPELAGELVEGLPQQAPQMEPTPAAASPAPAIADSGLSLTPDLLAQIVGEIQARGPQAIPDLLAEIQGHARPPSARTPVGQRAPEYDMTELQALADRMPATPKKSPLRDNASGDSAASLEAQSRLAQEKAAGQTRYQIDADGTVTPLIGVNAVDAVARPGQIIVQRGIGNTPYTILDSGEGVHPNAARNQLARMTKKLDKLGATEAVSRGVDEATPKATKVFGGKDISAAIRKIEPQADRGTLVQLSDLRAAMKKEFPTKAAFDAAIMKMAEAGELQLQTHAWPGRLTDAQKANMIEYAPRFDQYGKPNPPGTKSWYEAAGFRLE